VYKYSYLLTYHLPRGHITSLTIHDAATDDDDDDAGNDDNDNHDDDDNDQRNSTVIMKLVTIYT